MKQLFALFCAFVLLPSFSAQAWIGGPFGGNNFFGESGDDGVYEAVGVIDPGSVFNSNTVVAPIPLPLFGMGSFRWGVVNNTDVLGATNISGTLDNLVGGQFIPTGTPAVANTFFGGISGISHIWFINGVSYLGVCTGSANSALGGVFAVGTADSVSFTGSLDAGFYASFDDEGQGLPARRFEGVGEGTFVPATGGVPSYFTFGVFGSKVSRSIFFGGNFLN